MHVDRRKAPSLSGIESLRHLSLTVVGIIGATEYVVNTPKLLYRSTPQDCDYSHMTAMSVRSFNLNEGLRIPVSINLIQLLYVHFSRPWNCNPFFHIPPARVQDIQN